jgi:cell division protein FtsI/penicillin-binding protein 2
MKKAVTCVLVIFLLSPSVFAVSLYEQWIARALEKRFTSPSISYLLLDAHTGRVVASRWEEPGRPVALGSLVKPFTALAYGQRHEFKYPEFVCTGVAGGCWLPRGHGRIGMRQAIAFSCNAYFRALAAQVRAEDVSQVMRRFGIESQRGEPGAPALVGLGDDWRISPEQVARGYCELASQSAEVGAIELIRGMALSAQAGTGSAVGRALAGAATLVKTGTAPCAHQGQAPGDGYVIALYPAESPRLALLVRVHGAPGAQAAVVGGQMLRAAVDGK